ncbi:chaperone binding protein [Diplodia corticola]|uniref:Chaperone binding protein n=1 Tax=Diplodia corticola TaxID=236234 RepID=A0A1J9S1Z7_9PEZI|nr:chaperone binding protein [Diplodia corticola]OJD38979.1 chaperone binding protein [Diplodia corticola]
MRVQQSKIQKAKTACHAIQGLLIFVAGCITIAIFTKDGTTDGRSRYFFALCFVTVPALIYLVAVPMWSRTVRFAHAYAFATVDFIYTVLWFAAFICVATWNSDGIAKGAKEANTDKGNCTTFAYGPELKCKLSQATVGFGVVITVLFITTCVISFYYCTVYRRTGVLVGAEENTTPGAEGTSYFGGSTAYQSAPKTDDDNGVWSSNTHDIETSSSHYDHHDPSDFGDAPPMPPLPTAGNTGYGGASAAAAIYTPLVDGRDTDDGRHPGVPLSYGDDHYGGDHPAYRPSPSPSQGDSQAFHIAPSALSPPSTYDDYRTKNYNFSS